MPLISTCPECGEQVSVPDGLSSEAKLRCPLCEAEYAGHEVLAALPPMLVVVDPGPAPAAAEPAADGSQAAAAATVAAADVEPTGETTAEAAETGAEAAFDFWKRVDEAPKLDLGAGDSADERHVGVDTSVFAGFAAEDQQEDEAEGGAERAAARRLPARKRKEKSVVKELVGAILGGVVGLTLGYYLLNLVGGERFDFLEIPLPFVSHTYKHWSSAPSGEDGAAAGQAPAAKTPQPKKASSKKAAPKAAPKTMPAPEPPAGPPAPQTAEPQQTPAPPSEVLPEPPSLDGLVPEPLIPDLPGDAPAMELTPEPLTIEPPPAEPVAQPAPPSPTDAGVRP
jgi:hypothetical protein